MDKYPYDAEMPTPQGAEPEQWEDVPFEAAGTPPPPGMEPDDRQLAAPARREKPERGARGPRRGKRAIEVSLISLSLATIVMLALLVGVVVAVLGFVTGLVRPSSYSSYAPAGSFSVIRIQGDILEQGGDALGVNDPSYHHAATLEYIKALTENEEDKGILLYLNTPGGGVYESDELYRALESYREKTGRPVWAYMANTCASGGYYVSMAAEKLVANYNTTTGSIGVYISLTDFSGLYDKLGLEAVVIRSGENKGVSVPGIEITDENRAVFQSSVDESYDRFVDLIVQGRDMPRSDVLALADGRTFTATQALEAGLIDEMGEWDAALEAFEEETGGTAVYPSFSRQSRLGQILSGVLSNLPQGETEAVLSMAEELPQGVPLAYALELA